jgi:hypothetical protein
MCLLLVLPLPRAYLHWPLTGLTRKTRQEVCANNQCIFLSIWFKHWYYNHVQKLVPHGYLPYFIEYSEHFFYIKNDAEIFPEHYTWKVAEKGFKTACMMNKLAMINSFEIILEK